MDLATYTDLSRALVAHADEIQTAKRPGYTVESDDVVANFKRVGDRVHTTCPHCQCSHAIGTEAAWAAYFLKHVDALTTIMTRPAAPVSEAPVGRFADALNYLRLGWALLNERELATKRE